MAMSSASRSARSRARSSRCVQRLAVDVLHRDVALAVWRLAELVDVADVRMIQRRGGAGFLLEPRKPVGFCGDLGKQHLQRDAAIQLPIAREIYLPHATRAEQVNNLETAELRAGRQRHRFRRIILWRSTGKRYDERTGPMIRQVCRRHRSTNRAGATLSHINQYRRRNDLDVDTLRALEEALLSFAGCAVVISHDRWFLDRIATHMLAFEGDSRVVWFEGNYQDYEADRHRRLGAEADQPHRIKYSQADPLTAADPATHPA